MDARELGEPTAIETLAVLDDLGYQLDVKTRVDVRDHPKSGEHRVTYADKLLVSGGPGPLDETLREAVRKQQPYLLAAACVRRPPMKWLEFVVRRARAGEIPVSMLAANVASFLGKHPAKVGPDREPISARALRSRP